MVTTDFAQLTDQLRHWERRRRGGELLRWAPRGLLAGLLAAVIVATVARLRPLLTNVELVPVALILAGAGLAAAVIGLLWQWRRRSLLQQARYADSRLSLQERTSAAVELALGRLSAPPALVTAQLDDAVAAARRADARAALPLRPVWRDWVVLVAAAALLALAVALPNPQASILSTQRAVAEKIAEEAAALEALQDEIAANEALTEAQREALQEPITEALSALEEGDLSREAAVAALSEAEADLRDLEASNDNEALRRQLDAAAAPLANNRASQALAGALQGGDLSGASAATNALADAVAGLSADEQAALAESLAEAAEALAGTDAELAQELAAAAAALRNGDAARAQDALRAAAGTLQQRAQEAAAARQAGAAADRLAEGRSAVAQAGQEGQGGATAQAGGGEGGETSAGSSGEGSGQGSGAGQEGAGSGSGSSGDGGAGVGVGPDAGGIGGETGHAESVYVPDFADLSQFEGEAVELPAECVANPENCGALLNETDTPFGDEQSVVPYSQVFGDYRDAAYRALDDDRIPLGLKGYVRDYFSSLEP